MLDDLLADQYCPACDAVRPVEAPPCRDGHGTDCPDRACTGCGSAAMLATPGARGRRTAARHAA